MDELFRNAAECMTEEAFFRIFDEDTLTAKERAVLKGELDRRCAADMTWDEADGGTEELYAAERGML